MKAFLVIDMQAGMFNGPRPYDIEGVVNRINSVAAAIRSSGGLVVFIQHQGPVGDDFEEGEPGWKLLPTLERVDSDCVVAKTICDAFFQSILESLLEKIGVDELFIAGWATDFCVDTTVRAAGSRGYSITVVSDGHTAADRPHLTAEQVIRHHNTVWAQMDVANDRIRLATASEIVGDLSH